MVQNLPESENQFFFQISKLKVGLQNKDFFIFKVPESVKFLYKTEIIIEICTVNLNSENNSSSEGKRWTKYFNRIYQK